MSEELEEAQLRIDWLEAAMHDVGKALITISGALGMVFDTVMSSMDLQEQELTKLEVLNDLQLFIDNFARVHLYYCSEGGDFLAFTEHPPEIPE